MFLGVEIRQLFHGTSRPFSQFSQQTAKDNFRPHSMPGAHSRLPRWTPKGSGTGLPARTSANAIKGSLPVTGHPETPTNESRGQNGKLGGWPLADHPVLGACGFPKRRRGGMRRWQRWSRKVISQRTLPLKADEVVWPPVIRPFSLTRLGAR